MPERNIYRRSGIKSDLTQGSVVSGCVSIDYPDSEVFGLVITPRCDMDHEVKVSTVHYLPIISFEDWVKKDGIELFKKRLYASLKDRLENWVTENYQKPDLMNSSLVTEEKILSLMEEKKAKPELKTICSLYFQFTDDKIKHEGDNSKKLKSSFEKIQKKIIDELKSNQLASFYLLEHWSEKRFMVVNLREPRVFVRKYALMYKQGFMSDELSEKDYFFNSFSHPADGDSVMHEQITVLDSPFMEHLLQRFAHNFTRIGVEDIDASVVESLKFVV